MLHECTSIDGGDTQSVLQAVFDALDLKEHERGNVPQYAKRFPYVNGGLFRDRTTMPRFTRLARRILIDAAKPDWSEINPDIFGSMIQAIVKPEMREELGLHYTSVPNIMKVIRPLFIESLEQELALAKGDTRKLKAVLERICRIRVFDPACGSGNFLIISYKELCRLEMEAFDLLRQQDRQFRLPFSGVRFENFIGIEIEDFAVETTKLSLYIAQHQMNLLFRQRFDVSPPDLPLKDGGRVHTDNAARINWETVCPYNEALETYIIGNPPYLGMTYQNEQQKADVADLFCRLVRGYKELDYVACWLLKAADYCQRGSIKCSLVTTNSICQGELVALLWPLIFERQMEIGFAYQSFKWKNSAAHNAGVTCVIIGLRPISNEKKRLFESGVVRDVKNISPYLVEGDNTIVHKRRKPLSGFPYMAYGNKPTDGGHFILSPREKDALLANHPEASRFLRRYYGSQEFIKGIERWCLWIHDSEVDEAHVVPEIARRIDGVRAVRQASPAASTVEKAAVAHRFIQIQDYGKEAIIVPKVSSEKRLYLPVGLVGADSIINDLAFGIYDAAIHFFAILSSRIHLVWAMAASGKLEDRLRYSNTMVWNTFPLPELSSAQINQLEDGAWAIIAEREKFPGQTIASLYDSETMPAALLAAHREVDAMLEHIYVGHSFKGDSERLEHLFKRYKLMIAKEKAPLLTAKKSRKKLDG